MAHAIDFDPKTAWDGGKSPFRVSYGKMFMWFFLISDALTFGGLLCAYGFARHAAADEWALAEKVFTHFPFVDKHVPLAYVGLMTFILIMSSVTMVLAVEAGHRMNKKGVMTWLFLTIIGGLMFVGSQAWEWFHFIVGTHEGGMIPQIDPETGERVVKQFFGANMSYNEYGAPQFANFFFFITGFHGTHVFSGVVINIIIFINVVRGVYQRRGHYEMVEKVGLYWHFVDLVWVFVFTFFYLL